MNTEGDREEKGKRGNEGGGEGWGQEEDSWLGPGRQNLDVPRKHSRARSPAGQARKACVLLNLRTKPASNSCLHELWLCNLLFPELCFQKKLPRVSFPDPAFLSQTFTPLVI